MRLLRVELRRLFSRRLVVLTMVGALLASFLVLFGVWQSSQPLSEQELEYAEQMYQEQVTHWEEHGEEIIEQCREDEAAAGEDYGCDEMEPPQREWFVTTAPPLQDSLPQNLSAHSTLLVFAALLIGATFAAADLSTGAMSTWLSFEPRRLRVYASKAIAAAVGVLPMAALAVVVVIAGCWLIADGFGLADGMGAADWGATAWTAARIVGLVALVALAGTALGFLLRHTAAVLGLAVVYLIGEQLLTGLLAASKPWVLSTNVGGWVMHGTTYYIDECTTDASGTTCEFTEHALSFGHSAVYLLVLTATVVVLGAVVFRRRDVA